MRLGTLVRNETIKTVRRPAAWVTYGFLVVLLLLIVGGSYVQARVYGRGPVPSLPNVWAGAGMLAALPELFGAILLILLVAGEFTWRTARQNVIDGLSKDEFFVGKLWLLPVVVIVLYATLLAILVAFALPGTALHQHGSLIQSIDAKQLAGALLASVGVASIAFFFAMTVRSSGAAVGVFFLYVIVEQIGGQALARMGAFGATAARLLPWTVFDQLGKRATYDPATLHTMMTMLRRVGQASPPDVAASTFVALGAGYIVALVAGSFLIFRKRDL